uniref:Uncharacterized protein n=1 Tax=Panagrolaimus sp. JU765 TaxID=591449 RepID=A0AC34RC18_9BILA
MESPMRNKRPSTTGVCQPTPKMRIIDDEEHKENQRILFQRNKLLDNSFQSSDGFGSPKPADFSDDEPENVSVNEANVSRKKLRRSISLPDLVDAPNKINSPAPGFSHDRNDSILSINLSTNAVTSFADIENRRHNFKIRRAFIKAMCMSCKQPMHFGIEAVRCKCCKWMCHAKCRENVGSCIPFKEVPKNVDGRLRLVDYCAEIRPRLPHPILRCVGALDKMLDSDGLYVKDADPKEVEKLTYDCIHKKFFTNCSDFSPEVISKAVLHFLSEIRDCLILKTSHDELMTAADSTDPTEFETVITDLPRAHRNTLAFLCLHWKKIIQNQVNGIDANQLASVVMPVLMKTQIDEQNHERFTRLFVRLLNLENAFWEGIIEEDAQDVSTPISRSSSKNYAYDKLARSITMSHMPSMRSSRFNMNQI